MDSTNNNVIIAHIKRRIEQNKNALLLFIGDTGSGKSYACMRLLEKINPNFGIKFIEFEPKNFLELINSNHTPMTCMMMDEVGVAMGARKWQSKFNIILSYVLQTFRFKRYVVGFTVPDLSFVDVHARKLFHYIIEARSIDHIHKISKLSFKRIQVNRNTGAIYKKCIRYEDQEETIKIAPFLRLKLPNYRLRQQYEKKRANYINELYLKSMEEMNDSSEENKKKKVTMAHCTECNHKWRARVKDPRRCPACFAYNSVKFKAVAAVI